MKKIPAVATVVVLMAAAFTGGILVTGQDVAGPATTTTASEPESTTALPDPQPTATPDRISTPMPSRSSGGATSSQETREERCYQLSETGTYAEWSVACEGVEPLSQDEPVADVGNPYGEDYDEGYGSDPGDVGAAADDGSAAIVAEMRRQEQQRRSDEWLRQEHERQQAYTDQYNAQVPKGYDYSR